MQHSPGQVLPVRGARLRHQGVRLVRARVLQELQGREDPGGAVAIVSHRRRGRKGSVSVSLTHSLPFNHLQRRSGQAVGAVHPAGQRLRSGAARRTADVRVRGRWRPAGRCAADLAGVQVPIVEGHEADEEGQVDVGSSHRDDSYEVDYVHSELKYSYFLYMLKFRACT